MSKNAFSTIIAACAITMALDFAVSGIPDEKAESAKNSKTAIRSSEPLKHLNGLVGSWRGVGQVRRGSRNGAWAEKVTCEWSFEESQPAVVIKSEGGKQFERLNLTWDEMTKRIVLKQKLMDTIRTYSGTMPEKWPGKLELVSKSESSETVYRCTIQQLSEIRATLLFEKKTLPSGSFRRIAGVGYTRSGSKLAVRGGNQQKCIVTGGLGTIAVMHKGKTYYVCCQGCVQAFNDAPDDIIAEYQASLRALKKK